MHLEESKVKKHKTKSKTNQFILHIEPAGKKFLPEASNMIINNCICSVRQIFRGFGSGLLEGQFKVQPIPFSAVLLLNLSKYFIGFKMIEISVHESLKSSPIV